MEETIKKVYKMFIDEEDQDSGVFAISLVENPAIESNWIYLSKQHKIELATVNNEKRLLLGPVLIPNKQIPRYDETTGEEYDIVFDEAVIEKAAQLYMQRQHNNDATLEHDQSIEDISIVESWIVADSKADKSNAYKLSYPKGTWLVMAKVNNDEIWNDYVKTGAVKGFSLEGLFGHNLVEASKQTHLTALSEQFDGEFADEMLSIMKGIITKDGRLKDGQRVELESYNDYPDTVKNAAQRGIDLNAKVNNKCATEVGKIRAQQLANGRNISVQTIKRMFAYTSRAREFYNPDDTSACGTISYLLWGGDAANRWSAAKLKELGLFEGETAISVSSSYAGQFGPAKSKKPKKNNFVDTQNMESQFIAGPTSEKDKKRFPGNKGTMFYPYIAPAMLEDEVNMDVFGYKTKYFQICPGAQATFKSLVMLPNLEEDNIGMIRSAAVIADAIFKIENDVLESKKATQAQLDEAMVLVDDYKDIISEVDEDNSTLTDVSYMDGHIDTIKSYLTTELAEYEQGPCYEGYVQIGFKDLDGKSVPNCVPDPNKKEK